MSERDYGRDLIAGVTLEAMGIMKYDAVALGPQDLLLGPKPLRSLLSAARLPVVASNLYDGDTETPFEKPYVLVEKAGIRVGILSVMPPPSQEEQESNPFLKAAPSEKSSSEEAGSVTHRETFGILPMEEAVRKAVAGIAGKADIIILLSQAGYDETCDLVNRVPGIDLAVYEGGRRGTPGKTPEKTLLMRAPSDGTSIGYARFALEGGKAFLKQNKMMSLSCSAREPALPEDPAVAALVGDNFERKLVELRRERERQAEEQVIEEARELWKLSPREFLEMEMKKKAIAGTGEPAENPFMGR